jgi:hypothetical protein
LIRSKPTFTFADAAGAIASAAASTATTILTLRIPIWTPPSLLSQGA